MVRAVVTVVARIGAVIRRVGAIDIRTVDIAPHETQSRHAITGHVQVITDPPGLFARPVEVPPLHRVGQVDRVAAFARAVVAGADVVKRCVAMHFLERQRQRMRLQERVRRRQRVGGVVDRPGLGAAGVEGAVEVAVQRE